MSLLDELAEQRIREAAERGEFDELPGRGEPLALEDDSLVPEELRAGYRLLKNAGFVPPELESMRELREVETLIRQAEAEADRDARDRGGRRLRVVLQRLHEGRTPRAVHDYAERLRAHLERLEQGE
ncbi:MAG: DnaJ family domain-containing protein [Pseudomonadota bacterium]